MPIPRLQWLTAARRQVPCTAPHPSAATLVPPLRQVVVKGTWTGTSGREEERRRGEDPIASDAIAQWLFHAQIFKRQLDAQLLGYSTPSPGLEASPSPPPLRAPQASLAVSSSKEATGSITHHLKALTEAVKRHLPSPLPQYINGGDAKKSPVREKHHSTRTKRHAPCDSLEQDAAREVMLPHQQEMLLCTLTHVLRLRDGFFSTRSPVVSPTQRGQNSGGECLSDRVPAEAQGPAAWPWEAEVELIATLVASLPVAQRESFSSLAVLLSLLHTESSAGQAPSTARNLPSMGAGFVCLAVERALREAGDQNSCLPWLLHRLGRADSEMTQDESGDQEAEGEARRRWLALTTQQLCDSTAWSELGLASTQQTSAHACVTKDGDRENAAPLPPHLHDLYSILTLEDGSWQQDAAGKWDDTDSVPLSLRGGSRASVHKDKQGEFTTEWLWSHAYVDQDAKHIIERHMDAVTMLPAAQVFQPYFVLTLTEMLASAWEGLSGADAKGHSSHHNSQGEFHAVGVYQALRRFASALSRYQRLRPLLSLSALVRGEAAASAPTEETPASFAVLADQWRRVILCEQPSAFVPSPLLWRELALFDAYSLITVGHVCERAVDFDAVAASSSALRDGVTALQSACVAHLVALTTPRRASGKATEASHGSMRALQKRVTPRTRADLVTRLQEGLRLSAKVHLRMGDNAALCMLHQRWPTMGGSWEVAKALTAAGQSEAALDVFTRFFEDTRKQYAAEVPQAIRQLALETVECVGKGCVSQTSSVDVPRALEEIKGAYARLQRWHPSLPPSVCADALLRGMFKCDAVPLPLRLQVAAAFLRCHCDTRKAKSEGACDGLLTGTIETFVEHLLALRNTTDPNAVTEDITRVVEDALSLLSDDLLFAFPEVPVLRMCLTHFLREDYDKGVATLLYRSFAGSRRHHHHHQDTIKDGSVKESEKAETHFTDAFLQGQLNTFPLIALQALAAKLSSGSQTRRDLMPRAADLVRLQAIVEAALQLQVEKREREHLPWQCILCRTWNNRFAAACKLCKASAATLVQCASCGGFGSSRDGSCGLCGARFLSDVEEEAGLNGGTVCATSSAGLTAGVGRDADSLLSAPCFKAVHALRPWRCNGCHHQNAASHAFYCAGCGSAKPEMSHVLQEGAYTCPTCRQRNAMGALRPWCGVCGSLSPKLTEVPQGGTSSRQTDPPECRVVNGSVLPAKTLWFCVECHRLNPWLLAHCDCCGAGRPPSSETSSEGVLDGPLSLSHAASVPPRIEVPWTESVCRACSTVNPVNSVFCRACGEVLQTDSQSAEPQALCLSALRTWRATEVFDGNNIVPHPERMESNGASETTPHMTPTSAARHCPHCKSPLSATTTTVPPDGVVVPTFTRKAAPRASTVNTCPHCHAVDRASLPAELWVCLYQGCLHVNLTSENQAAATTSALDGSQEGKEEGVCCVKCGHVRGDQLGYLWHHGMPLHSRSQQRHLLQDPLGYRSPSSSSSLGTLAGKEATGIDRVTEGASLPAPPAPIEALVLMPLPTGPTQQCTACHQFLAVDNMTEVCPSCGHCSLSPADPLPSTRVSGSSARVAAAVRRGGAPKSLGYAALQMRLLLHQLHHVLRPRVQETGEVRNSDFVEDDVRLCAFLHSLLPVLRTARDEVLPWRGCDPAHGLRCGAEPQLVTLAVEHQSGADVENGEGETGAADEEVLHSAVVELRETVEDLCRLAGEACRSSNPDAVSQRRRLLLAAALELVDALNRSTAFDEIGFPTLAKLCLAIRPEEAGHIQAETRWTYLRDMKLSKEAIVHGHGCLQCLGQHSEGEPCLL